MAIDYRFIPWARRGLTRAVQTVDAAGVDARPAIQVSLSITADQDGAPAAAVSGNVGLRLFGPADVMGIDTRLILRTDPKPFATSFEPNYLALVDFDPPDFPWMFTPAQPTPGQRLRPWLVLLVFDRRKVALPRLRSGAPLPSVVLPLQDAQGQAVADAELPDLADSWMWAHAQATSAAANKGELEGELLQRPERNVSRLLSTRRLEPSQDYFACLVPAFEVGRRRGLGEPLTAAAGDPLTLQPAWTRPFVGAVTLPVYFHWEFSTGPAGDFETLARRIQTPRTYAQGDPAAVQALSQRLSTLGTVPMALDADRLLINQPTPTLYEGALTSLNFVRAALPGGVADKLQTIVNAPQNLLMGAGAAQRAPTVAPPIYGAWHARKHVVNNLGGRWLNDLNRDPRPRAAAGMGTRVVQEHQEVFMDACWGQVGEVLRTERALALAAMAKEVGRVLHSRLKKLPDDRLLAVAGPATSRIRLGAAETVLARIQQTSVPNAIADPALRRFTSAQRPALKAAVRRAAGASVAQQVAAMVQTLVKATANPEAIDPNRYVPDGILGSKSFEGLQLPADPSALVDLAAIGLPGSLRAGEIRAAQEASRAARDWYASRQGESRVWRPELKAVREQGLLTEAHFVRFAQLSATASRRVSVAEIARQVQATGAVRQSEGVLVALADVQGQVQTTVLPLRIDARSGAIQTLAAQGRQPRAPRPAPSPAARAAGPAFGKVFRQQVGQFGNGAVFSTLPPNTLPLVAPDQPVAIGSRLGDELGGLFSGTGQAALPQGLATITVAAPVRDSTTLARFAAAVKEHNQLWRPPLDAAGVKVKPLDFPLATVATALRQRTDPALTVPARLAATLSFGGNALQMDANTRALSNPFVAHVLPAAGVLADVRYVLPRLFDRVMAYPKIEEPMSVRLGRLDPEAMMPGAQAIPNDFLVLAKTNNRFVEAFMVGINHEMARELLWRRFPTDQRGTPMRHFWDRLDDQPDIHEIHTWSAALALGNQPPVVADAVPGDKLVLVIRATLIKRFPNLSIYARLKHPAQPRLAAPDDFNPARSLDDIVRKPVFAGPLSPDLVYVGFDIPGTPADAAQWCFVLEEQMTEPRFGFDEPDSGRVNVGGPAAGWKDVLWRQVLPPGARFVRPGHLVDSPPGLPVAERRTVSLPATAHAAQVAQALLQRPFRAYYLGSDLVPAP
jgi:hypothetical protein